MPETLTLYSDGLLSKWGFSDGDLPDDLWDYFDEHLGQQVHPAKLYPVWRPVLAHLVRTRLVPALDQHVEVYEIGTNHNPIRALTVDGVPIADEVMYGLEDGPTLTPESVQVPYADVLALIRKRLAVAA